MTESLKEEPVIIEAHEEKDSESELHEDSAAESEPQEKIEEVVDIPIVAAESLGESMSFEEPEQVIVEEPEVLPVFYEDPAPQIALEAVAEEDIAFVPPVSEKMGSDPHVSVMTTEREEVPRQENVVVMALEVVLPPVIKMPYEDSAVKAAETTPEPVEEYIAEASPRIVPAEVPSPFAEAMIRPVAPEPEGEEVRGAVPVVETVAVNETREMDISATLEGRVEMGLSEPLPLQSAEEVPQIESLPQKHPVTEMLTSVVQFFRSEAVTQQEGEKVERVEEEKEAEIQVVESEGKITISAKSIEGVSDAEGKLIEPPIATLSHLQEALDVVATIIVLDQEAAKEEASIEKSAAEPSVEIVVTEEIVTLLQLLHDDKELFPEQPAGDKREAEDRLISFTTGDGEPKELQMTKSQLDIIQEVLEVLGEDEAEYTEEEISVVKESDPIAAELMILMKGIEVPMGGEKETVKLDVSKELLTLIAKDRIIVEAVMKLTLVSEKTEKEMESQELILVSGEEEMKIDTQTLKKIRKLQQFKHNRKKTEGAVHVDNASESPVTVSEKPRWVLPESAEVFVSEYSDNTQYQLQEVISMAVRDVEQAPDVPSSERVVEVSEDVLSFIEEGIEALLENTAEEDKDEAAARLFIFTSGEREIVIDLVTLKKLQQLVERRKRIMLQQRVITYEGAPEEVKRVVVPYQGGSDPSLLLIYQALVYAFGLESQQKSKYVPDHYSLHSSYWYN